MKILVYGSGGREHALVKAFAQSSSKPKIFAFPGNDGMIEADRPKINNIVEFCKSEKIDFVFIGPEDPLCSGLSDELRKSGIPTVGPDKAAAQLEGSKIFSKNFMLKYGIPTARAVEVSSVQAVEKSISAFKAPYVIKADGLAAGKGVVVTDNPKTLIETADNFFNKKTLGDAGSSALLEEGLVGWEMSVLLLTNGSDFQLLPIAQDHKRLSDGGKGPNTGGMGTIAPITLDKKFETDIIEKIIQPTLRGIREEKWLYRGIVFIGIMVTDKGPMVLEYNTRFGDPETQVILPLIKNDLVQVFSKLANGELSPLQFKSEHACCVILAAPGYPSAPEKGVTIQGDPLATTANSYFVHAGTKKTDQWITNGGRVLGAVGVGSSKAAAIEAAYRQAKLVSWNGLQMRSDIGATPITVAD